MQNKVELTQKDLQKILWTNSVSFQLRPPRPEPSAHFRSFRIKNFLKEKIQIDFKSFNQTIAKKWEFSIHFLKDKKSKNAFWLFVNKQNKRYSALTRKSVTFFSMKTSRQLYL